jgi:hypothetical protein
MENTYWNHQGKFQKEFDEIIKLMPGYGNSDVLAGELIRSVNRLAYDFYNNGMGNNTSGAVNFLKHHSAISEGVYDTIHPWTTGRVYNGNYDGDALQLAIEAAIDMTVEMIVRNPQLMTMANEDDLFNYSDEDRYYDDEYEEEEYEY